MPLQRPARRPSTPVAATTVPVVVPGLPPLGSAEFLALVHEHVRRMSAPQTSPDAHEALDDLRRAYLGLPPGTELAGVDPEHHVVVVLRDAVSIRARRRPSWFLDRHGAR